MPVVVALLATAAAAEEAGAGSLEATLATLPVIHSIDDSKAIPFYSSSLVLSMRLTFA